MEKFDRDHVSQDTVSKCIADLTLEKCVLGERIEYLESLTEAYKKSEGKANDRLNSTENELVNVREQLDAANRQLELVIRKAAELETSNKRLEEYVSGLTVENRRLKGANETLKAFLGNVRVVNIVTEFVPKEPLRTTVYWGDGKPTTVTLAKGDTADHYTAFCAAFAKKFFGSTHKVRKLVEDKRTIVCFDEGVKDEPDAGH